MKAKNSFYCVTLRRFFEAFQGVTYHRVPICHYVYRHFMSFIGESRLQTYLPYVQDEMRKIVNSQIYSWLDGPYPYDPHPEGVIVMRGGFGDNASLYLPHDRFFLISPNQAEVDLIKLNRPDLISHNIQNNYSDNPTAVSRLNRQIAKVIQNHKDDPLFGSLDLLHWFEKVIPDLVRVFDAVHSLFARLNVAAVLTISSTYSMDGALNLIARSHRIPSFTVQHGLIAENDLFSHIPILATKKLVWGESFKKWYQQFGFPESRVGVIGSPRFDIVFNHQWCGPEKLRRMLGISPTLKVVVYATQIFRYAQTVTPIVLEGLRSIPNLFLVIMLHPGENPLPHEQLAAGYPNCKVVRFGHISLYDALSGADIFITYYSTAALEAMFFKLPVITVEPIRPTFSFGALGASLKVTEAPQLQQVVQRLLGDESYRTNAVNQYQKFLAEFCIPDGSASKRLFAEIERLCHQGGIA
ncbi:CDP-glycerol:poly(glycerophosphate) glycerophosphotransferase [Hydrogenispora ethanolica]|jgi:hypothetical protein|uniref:CDP-glycerol:poly(Glycerophosphate) glycerophosphotransferase n=1 Tax=Hydrogenispora ethanolica TaxID=1082276 RepID=A0A4R1RVJ1_HYDET|nr:CDP-glycerol glycerophosphotransferase family protein [Hydrogenispora ethanolica]TCL69962.1 CDP-glycerol:poly(glycerophosphate) glycerophosphotransferase [Hydrogenispora ethanolica]